MNDVVHGHCDSRFSQVADALADELGKGEELGASIAVDIDGELVVDIWGGHADRAKTVPWGQDTIVNFFSCTKTLTALAALIAIDRGAIDAFAPVAKYWPEFAENGKQDIEVRHLMSHTSGVSGWQVPFAIEDIYDWKKATDHLAHKTFAGFPPDENTALIVETPGWRRADIGGFNGHGNVRRTGWCTVANFVGRQGQRRAVAEQGNHRSDIPGTVQWR